MLTIAICTYSRVKLLKKCLDALLPQVNRDDVEVVVIDNNSKDTTKGLVESLQKEYSFLKYIFEEKQGLSVARNTAWQQSSATWIAYLDDDGIPHDNYLKRLIYVIENYDFDCFGGMYYGYYEDEKPRWISNDFGTKKLIRDDIGVIEKNTLSGGIFNVKRDLLELLDGFKLDYGMTGTVMRYGEESELQYRIREKGFVIGFDPELKMDHIVHSSKLALGWHLKRIYTEYRDSAVLKTNDKNIFDLIKVFVISIFKELPRCFKKWFFKKDYYFQNFIIDFLRPSIISLGTLNNSILRK
ncbi:glycosyltransferase family 2 protein [Nonlabens ulvanivorans]|uniref:GT2 family glycosyltransferase n=1 Tax=Nonlabens ulvanivorans TaxID=906888 RepID=A0A084JXT1_NONUL|nr:glycosyltransferase [Nonlabens ulvanivorans]KEZ93765.1 hypothetical protein IL45_06075 [Nonlabens ulvanivorans]PRX14364.1 GT2 family glycosyltransferase [Nonlabens ulvanivorans]